MTGSAGESGGRVMTTSRLGRLGEGSWLLNGSLEEEHELRAHISGFLDDFTDALRNIWSWR